MRYDSPHRRAFTLMELLVVIGIIGVLVAITLVVGNAVSNSTKKSTTQEIIRVLDTSLQAYVQDTGDIPPAFVEDPRAATNPGQFGNVLIPIVDGRNMSDDTTSPDPDFLPGNQVVNSAGLYVLQMAPMSTTTSIVKAKGSPTGKKSVDNIPSKMARQFDADVNDAAQPPLLTPMDAWGRPIRYVHPAFQGILTSPDANPNQDHNTPREVDKVLGPARTGTTYAFDEFRRNASTVTPPGATRNTAQLFPDSDGGRCVGNRPYFYSAGQDGLVGAYMTGATVAEDYNADNVYTTPPTFPAQYR